MNYHNLELPAYIKPPYMILKKKPKKDWSGYIKKNYGDAEKNTG